MRTAVADARLVCLLSLVALPLAAQKPAPLPGAVPLNATTHFALTNTRLQWLDYRGRPALKLSPLEGHERGMNQEMSALLTDSDFKDGVIELDVSGARRQGYSTTEDVSGFKGFIGVSFRVRGDTAERIYLRPENSRLNNQLYRNRSTQYEGNPDFLWDKLREDSPGVYESYVDLEPGAWTSIRIEVSGTNASLYVNGAKQPCLVVHDLKYGNRGGKIALWTRVSSEAYFANLRVTHSGSGAAGGRAPTRLAGNMNRSLRPAGSLLPAQFASFVPAPRQVQGRVRTIAPDSLRFAEVVNGTASVVSHLGRRAVKLTPSPEKLETDEGVFAILNQGELKDGTIELAVSGKPRAGAPSDSRGFIGLAFRVGAHGDQSELIYLRPTNGRTDLQVRRNRSVQYVSRPDFTWQRLRSESPGVYESYVDLEPGVWTTMKIVIAGTTARLYVNGAMQPCLVVNDLKRGASTGQIALWAHVETEGYFGAVTIREP